MENITSYQNGQQSKSNNNATESLNSSSTGREQEYYSSKKGSSDPPDNIIKNIKVESADENVYKVEKELASKVAKDYYSTNLHGSNLDHSLHEINRDSDQLKSYNQNITQHLSSVQIEVSHDDDNININTNTNQNANDSSASKSKRVNFVIPELQKENSDERPLEFETPQQTAKKLVHNRDTPEGTQEFRLCTDNDENSANAGEFYELAIERMNSNKLLNFEDSKNAIYMTQDEWKQKDIKQSESPENKKRNNTEQNYLANEQNTNAIDILLGINNAPKQENSGPIDDLRIYDEEEPWDEDNKNDNSHLYIDNTHAKHIIDTNFLKFNRSNDSNSIRSSEQINGSSLRSSSLMSAESELPVKEGWLLKRSYNSPSLIGWQRRYWIIKKNRLIYYKLKDYEKIDGVIDFNLLTCKITVDK